MAAAPASSAPGAPDVLLRGATVVTMSSRLGTMQSADIVLRGSRIHKVDPSAGDAAARENCRVIDCRGMIAIPGLINAHTHASEILLRGVAARTEDLYDWQWNLTYPSVRRFTAEAVRVGALLFSIEALLSGTTTIVDNANTARSLELARAAIEAYKTTGLRVAVARIIAIGPLADDRLLRQADQVQRGSSAISASEMLEDPAVAFEELEALMKAHSWTNGNVAVWPAPHKPNRTSSDSIVRCHDLARKYRARVSQPCSETLAERTVNGIPAIDVLRRLGALNEQTLLGHCTHVSAREIQMIRAAGASVAHLPVANLYLGSGVAPIPVMVDSGITVALGTDNANCNNTANMFREMTITALIHRGVNPGGGVISSSDVFAMATRMGAQAIGLGDELGTIEPGKRADIVLIRSDRVNLTPCHDPIETLLFQGTGMEVEAVFVDGKQLVEDGRVTFMAPEAVDDLRKRAQALSSEILQHVGAL